MKYRFEMFSKGAEEFISIGRAGCPAGPIVSAVFNICHKVAKKAVYTKPRYFRDLPEI